MLYHAFALSALAATGTALTLNVAASGGNASSSLLYGLLYEDIYHSGDGGMYAELIRNRAFQGSNANGAASTARNTGYWHPIGGVSLSIDQSTPQLSNALPYQMRMDVPAGTTGTVGFYNDGFWGFDVDATKRYISNLYIRGDYSGPLNVYFKNAVNNAQLSSASVQVSQKGSDGWKQYYSPTFTPTSTPQANPNNTFYFTFDGSKLAGKSLYFNLFSLFKQTYMNRVNGLREDLANAVNQLGGKYLRLPGGNNMEGNNSPYYWDWQKTIGPLESRPGRPGTWGDVNTDGLGLLEMLQWCLDMNLTPILAVWAGFYLDGETVAQNALQPYVDQVMNELEFLLGDSSTTYGAQRTALGYPQPFNIPYVEIGNEDFLNGGTNSYYSYRFNAFYNPIHAKYPQLKIISTINPSPQTATGSAVDLHPYGNEAYFASLFNTFDQASRKYPVLVGEYATTNIGNNNNGQVGAQTMSMACAEAIFLLGCERNSDVVFGTSYGALIKEYNEEPGTVAVIKHTANEVLLTMSYFVQQLFAANKGSSTLPVTATNGSYGPVYWSATKNSTSTILKLVNYNGKTGTNNPVTVVVQGSSGKTGTIIRFTAPNGSSVNNLPWLGGITSKVTRSSVSPSNNAYAVSFTSAYEIVVLVV